ALGGEEVLLGFATWTETLDALVARHPGAGVPAVSKLDAPVADAAELSEREFRMPALDGSETLRLCPQPPFYSDFGQGNQVVDRAAKVRIEAAHDKLRAAGVDVDTSNQLYETGTRMARVGYETQEHRRAEFEGQMALVDAAETLRRR